MAAFVELKLWLKNKSFMAASSLWQIPRRLSLENLERYASFRCLVVFLKGVFGLAFYIFLGKAALITLMAILYASRLHLGSDCE